MMPITMMKDGETGVIKKVGGIMNIKRVGLLV